MMRAFLQKQNGQKTQIPKSVKKLRKHVNEAIKGLAEDIYEKYTNIVLNDSKPSGEEDEEEDDDDDVDPYFIVKALDDETPGQIAAKFKVSIKDLMKMNERFKGIKPNSKLQEGTTISVPRTKGKYALPDLFQYMYIYIYILLACLCVGGGEGGFWDCCVACRTHASLNVVYRSVDDCCPGKAHSHTSFATLACCSCFFRFAEMVQKEEEKRAAAKAAAKAEKAAKKKGSKSDKQVRCLLA